YRGNMEYIQVSYRRRIITGWNCRETSSVPIILPLTERSATASVTAPNNNKADFVRLPFPTVPRAPVRLIGVIGLTQILAWGSTFYLPAVLATPIARDSGWSLSRVVAGLSWGAAGGRFHRTPRGQADRPVRRSSCASCQLSAASCRTGHDGTGAELIDLLSSLDHP